MMNFKSVLGISFVGIALLGNGVLASAAVTDNLNESQSSMVINTKEIRDLNLTFEYNYFDNDQPRIATFDDTDNTVVYENNHINVASGLSTSKVYGYDDNGRPHELNVTETESDYVSTNRFRNEFNISDEDIAKYSSFEIQNTWFKIDNGDIMTVDSCEVLFNLY